MEVTSHMMHVFISRLFMLIFGIYTWLFGNFHLDVDMIMTVNYKSSFRWSIFQLSHIYTIFIYSNYVYFLNSQCTIHILPQLCNFFVSLDETTIIQVVCHFLFSEENVKENPLGWKLLEFQDQRKCLCL